MRLVVLLVLIGVLALVGAAVNYTTDAEADKDLPQGAKLEMAQVIFRDVARTPLSDRYLHKEVQWTGCRFDATKAPEITLITPEGRPLPPKQTIDTSHAPGTYRHGMLNGGCYTGMVTEAGFQQGVALGAWLHSRYITRHKLLGADPASQLYARTSFHNRTLLTLKSVLLGLGGGIPGAAGAGAAAGQGLQLPRSVKAVATEPSGEVMYANLAKCKVLSGLMRRAERETHAPVEGMEEEGRDAAQSVRLFLGLPQSESHSWVSWKRLQDAIMCLEANALPTYPGLTEILRGMIEREATMRVAAVVGPPCPAGAVAAGGAPAAGPDTCQGLLQLGVGPLLALLGSQLKAAVSCSETGWGSTTCASTPRLALWSGHDTTLLPIMAAFGEPLASWPPFASFVSLELWSLAGGVGPGRFAVRALYNGKPLANLGGAPTTGTAAVLGSGLSGGLIPLQDFEAKVMARFAADQWSHTQLCQEGPNGWGGGAGAAGGTTGVGAGGGVGEKGMGHVGHVVGAVDNIA